MTPDMSHALATAVQQWHRAAREYEAASLRFADAQTQLQHAERDLHELSRAIEVATGVPMPTNAELVTSSAGSPIGAVTMPIVPAPNGATADGLDAAQVVLEEMQRMRMGQP